MVNNAYSDGDIFYALDANGLNVRFQNPRFQISDRVLSGYKGATTTNFTEAENGEFDIDIDITGSIYAVENERNSPPEGFAFSDLGSSSGTFETESFPSDNTITTGSGQLNYQFLDSYDNWDSSVSTALWTTSTTGSGTVTEDSTKLILAGTNGTATAMTEGTGSNNLQSKKYIATYVNWVGSGSGATTGSATVYIYLNDGSSDTVIWQQVVAEQSASGTSHISGSTLFEFYHDTTNKRVLVYYNGRYLTRYTYATSTLRIKFYALGKAPDGVDATINVYFVGTSKSSPTTTVTHTISADGGSNYESYTENDYHTFTDTGNDIRLKGAFTIDTSEFVLIKGWQLQIDGTS